MPYINEFSNANADTKSIRQQLNRRVAAMKNERSSFDSHYKELAQWYQPRRGRFFVQDRNQGNKRHQSIINSAGTRALRKARAGLFAGTMSPSRPWFKLETHDPSLMSSAKARWWCHEATALLQRIFNSSNLYQMAPVMIGELLLFGTGGMTDEDDYEDVKRLFTHTVGSYMVAQNDRFVVDTVAREFQMTVEQVARKFGIESMSVGTRSQYDSGNYDTWVDVNHCIYPNSLYKASSPLSQNKKYASVYWEPGSQASFDSEKLLSYKGFDQFPGYFPRWETTGEDVYGTECPGMVSLGDVKGLQIMEKRKAQAIDYIVRPHLHGPGSLLNKNVRALPGGMTIYDQNGTQELKPVWTPNINLADLKANINEAERRIDDSFYVDLFLAITEMEGVQPRNEFELNQRNQERLLQLGPVLQSVHGEFLMPMVDRTFNQAAAAGILPPAPEELLGQPIKTEFISSLALAQRQVGMGGINTLLSMVAGAAKTWVDAPDKVDIDEVIEETGMILGVNPRLVRSDDDVAAIREQRAQQQAQAQQVQMAQMGADAAAKGGQAMKSFAEAGAAGGQRGNS